jgi:polyisoprenoid-binding protein YceI
MTRLRIVPRITATLAAVSFAAATASAQLVHVGEPLVAFMATGPGGLQIKGHTTKLSVRDMPDELEITVPVTQLETGIGLRDRHLREHLHAEQHPAAKLVVKRAALAFPRDQQVGQGQAQGDFWLNGQKHPIQFSYQADRSGAQYQVQALATVDIRHHGLEAPCYMKLCVEPLVKLKVKFSVQDQ